MSPLSCRDVVARLLDYFARELPPLGRPEVDAHLGRCDRCVVYADQYQRTVLLARWQRI